MSRNLVVEIAFEDYLNPVIDRGLAGGDEEKRVYINMSTLFECTVVGGFTCGRVTFWKCGEGVVD